MEAENVKTGLSKTQIEIFKTNVADGASAKNIINKLERLIPSAKINFDLDDCDKILLVEFIGAYIDTFMISHTVEGLGFDIQLLE